MLAAMTAAGSIRCWLRKPATAPPTIVAPITVSTLDGATVLTADKAPSTSPLFCKHEVKNPNTAQPLAIPRQAAPHMSRKSLLLTSSSPDVDCGGAPLR